MKIVRTMDENSVENLAQVFKCFICMETLKEARLCPHCSKPCCYDCIRQWLTEHRSQCPHCRATLYLYNLVNCRWIEDVTQQLGTLQEVEDNAKREMCKIHNQKLSVFCLDCKQCICCECALWDGSHANHVFKQLAEICLQHARKINEERIRLQKRLSDLKGFIKEIDGNVEEVRRAKSERVDEIMHSTTQMISHLEELLKTRLSTLVARKNLWSEECSEIESILKSVKQQVTLCSKRELLLSSEKIMQSIAEFKNQPIHNFERLHASIDTEFPSEIVPPYEGGTFVISNFSILQSAKDPIYSPPLQASGLTWRLKVYPAGNGHQRGKFLSALFELSSGYPETSQYQYRVEMAHGDSSKTVVREFDSDFDVGECWGFNRFYRLDLLASEGYLNAEDDTLVLRFQVRPLSYYQKSRDQSWYIDQLQTAQDQYVKQIDDLKEQLTAEPSTNLSDFTSKIRIKKTFKRA